MEKIRKNGGRRGKSAEVIKIEVLCWTYEGEVNEFIVKSGFDTSAVRENVITELPVSQVDSL